MRPAQPPRLKWRAARGRNRGVWIIKDRAREIGTGAGDGERAKAEIALADYIIKNRQPSFGNGRPDQVLIGDCLSLYCDEYAPTLPREDSQYRIALEVDRLNEFWGQRYVSAISRDTSNAWVAFRCAQTDRRAKNADGRKIKPATAKRELVTLSAALNWCYAVRKPQVLDRPVIVALPRVEERRERYFTRTEIAALLWAALGFNRDGTRNRFRINRHLARFILIGFYTGTRHDAILRLQWMRNVNGGWFDLDAGLLYRRPDGAVETNKRRPPTIIPERLNPHLRRWRRLSTRYVVEYDGKPIASQLRRSWDGTRIMAGLGPDATPHVLRHTCATLLLQAGMGTFDVAGLLGTSEAMIQKTYGHHAMEHLQRVTNAAWARMRMLP
jgi:integrase